MQPLRVVDVAHVTVVQHAAPDLLKRLALGTVLWPREADLIERACEHAHDAMRARVVVDGRAVTFAPADHHQVELAVAFVHQVARVPAAHDRPVRRRV